MKYSVTKLFSIIEDSFRLKLSCYHNIIAEGGIYLAMRELPKIELYIGMNEWRKGAISFIHKVRNDKYRPRDFQNVQEELKKILEPKTSETNQLYINEVISRTNAFVKTVENDYITDINEMTKEIQKDFIKASPRNGVWKRLYQSLVTDGNSIWKLRNDVIKIRDEYLSTKIVKENI